LADRTGNFGVAKPGEPRCPHAEVEQTLSTDRRTMLQLVEAATEAAYELRRAKTGGKPWMERTPDERRRFSELVAAAFNHLATMGYTVTRTDSPGVVPGIVSLPLDQARSLWSVVANGNAPVQQKFEAVAALQSAIASAEHGH
jgi:hypothetical protein